jgi:hypothetical protein
VQKAGVDAHEHYFTHGILEGRDACFNYEELSLDELKCLYYHATPNDKDALTCWAGVHNGSLPFYAKSDMVAHLPVLEYYASQCNHITELGVRNGQSTVAFLYGLPVDGVLESYDIEETKFVTWLRSKNIDKWRFFLQSTIEPDLVINETDFILFDSYHSYKQLSKELEMHASKARKFLAFHDITSYANIGENGKEEGLKRAIDEYVNKNKCKIVYETYSCNGLLILEI